VNIQKQMTGEGSAVLQLEGELSVESAEMLRAALLEGLREQDQLLLNCQQTTSIDFFVIQMLCSAHRTSVVQEKLLTWQGTIPAEVKKTIEALGFARLTGCDLCPDGVRCMWL